MTCRSPLIHVEVDSMFNRSSIKTPLDLEPVRTKESLHTSIPLELLFTAPVRWAQYLSQHEIRSHTQSFCELQRILLPPSHLGSDNFEEEQINHLLDDSLVPQWSKPWCNTLEALNLTKNATTKPSEWERGEGEVYKGVWTFQSANRSSPTPGLEYLYSPFPLLAVMGKTRTSRTVRDALADCPRLNSNGKHTKSTAGRTGCWAGWIVRQDPADHPPGPRGLSAGRPRTVCPVHRAVCYASEENNGPSA
jgi:hypothetical protein